MSEPRPRRQLGDRRLAMLIVAFVACVMPLAFALNVWQDETYSLRTTSGDLFHAFRSATIFEGLPPLYPLLLDVWRALDGSVPFARAFSILCAAATICCGWAFAKRNLPNVAPLGFAFVLAAAPFLIFAALDIRLYALALLLTMSLLYTFFAGFFADRPSRRARIAHAVLAIAAMYTQYFLGALLLGCFLALIFARRWRAVRAYALLGVVVAIASLPIAAFLPQQLSTFRTTSGTAHFNALSVIVTLFTFALPHDWLPSWQRGAGNIAYWCGFVAAAAAAIVARPRATPALGALATIAFVVLGFFLTVPIALHQTLVIPRHLAVLLVPTLALIFALFDSFRGRGSRAVALYLVVYALFSAGSLVSVYRSGAKFGDFKRAAAYLQENERPGQTIYVYDQEMTTPLEYYYRGSNTVVGLPDPQRFDRFDARLFVFHSDAEVRAKLARAPRSKTIWLYEADLCSDRQDPFGCRFLEDVVRDDYVVVRERAFFHAMVRELALRGGGSGAK